MKRILLIEDNRIITDMYQTKLKGAGFEVSVAVDGEEGLQSALSTHPDLILLDLLLPKLDGMTMMQELRKDSWGEHVPIIILTNLDTSDEILKEVVQYQPAYYLMKIKTTPEEVVEQIKDVLNIEKN